MDAYPLEAAPWMRDLIRDEAVAFVGDAAHRKNIYNSIYISLMIFYS
jgi:hypothetical protein